MKNNKTYKILTICSFIVPLNRFYIGNLKGIFWRTLTLNYMMTGWAAGLFYMNKAFEEAMAKRGFMNTDIRNQQGR